MKNYYSKHVLPAFLTLCIVSLCLCACSKSVKIQTTDGTLVLSPLYSNAVRVQVIPDGQTLPEELVYTEKVRTPAFKVKKSDAVTELSTARMTVRYSNDNGTLTFLDAQGNVLLSEVPGGRKLQPSTVQDVPVYAVSQSFVSPKDEHLYGTGQFQDGYLDIRGLTRRLTQVNTQIAIPFVMSSKGYGLLWNNYGLTDFNPAEAQARLSTLPALPATAAKCVFPGHSQARWKYRRTVIMPFCST